MRIILLQNIKGLGRKFDVKEVKDGYARNFLLPKRLAKIADEKTVKELEEQKTAWQKQEAELKLKLENFAEILNQREFEFSVKTGRKKEVFGSVNKDEIWRKIFELKGGLKEDDLDELEVVLDRPIKTLGEHQVDVNLGRGVRAKIKLRLAQS